VRLKERMELDKKKIQFVIDCFFQKSRGDGILYNYLHDGRLFYETDLDQWHYWNDFYWDTDSFNFRLAEVEACCQLYEKAADEILKYQKEETGFEKFNHKLLLDRAAYLRTTKGRNACVNFAISNIRISEKDKIRIMKRMKDINKNPYIVPCRNAVIDLRTNEPVLPDPNEFMTNYIDVYYDSHATCENFEKNLMLVYDNDTDLIKFIQKLFGLALCGKVSEHIFVIFSGNGRNGKGVMLEDIMLSMFGTFGIAISENLLVESSYVQSANSPSPAMLSFLGKRYALASESTSKRNFHSELVKRLTGGDSITARAAYEKYNISFKPTHTLFFMTNTIPYVDPLDNAFWKRVIIVPHDIQFVDKPTEELKSNERKKVLNISDILLREKSGIFNWMLEGYQLYKTEGLVYPDAVKEAIAVYRDDVDTTGIRQYIKEYYTFDEDSKVLFSDVYDRYRSWYEENVSHKDRNIPSKRTFGSRVRAFSKMLKVEKFCGDTYIYGLKLSRNSDY